AWPQPTARHPPAADPKHREHASTAQSQTGARRSSLTERSRLNETFTLPVEGHGSGPGPLAWGQSGYFNYEAKNSREHQRNKMVIRLPGEMHTPGNDRTLSAVQSLLTRHGVLRTTYDVRRLAPTNFLNPDEYVVQNVLRSYAIPCIIRRDATIGRRGGLNPADAPRSLVDRFDFAERPPVQLELLPTEDDTWVAALVVSRMSTDAAGAAALKRDFEFFCKGHDLATLPPAAQPLDVQALEGSSALISRSDRALAYLERTLRSAPSDTYFRRSPRVGAGAQSLTSGRISTALSDIAASAGVARASVALALFGLLEAFDRGSTHGLIRSMFARPSPLPGTTYAAPNCFTALIPIHVEPTSSILDFVRTASRSAIIGYTHTLYDPTAYENMERDVSATLKCDELNSFCYFNYQSSRSTVPDGIGDSIDVEVWKTPDIQAPPVNSHAVFDYVEHGFVDTISVRADGWDRFADSTDFLSAYFRLLRRAQSDAHMTVQYLLGNAMS
ncbi:hypothetical protein ACFVH0_35710, partial [Streptomyces sp. NPDC127117]|uniref:hypothetical protein n=1 Tax=Streptomyces sp. NPDC127117 TaxID=3345368 RepID=UPI003645496A